ncbi:TPA: NAD(P)/FAD-dependent oxidoreductase [Candidatus Poribacteria bacterium]|nr:NAD(P)/FAD-dependent oxidoreductase [Candidatus Poribacteria bacterium]
MNRYKYLIIGNSSGGIGAIEAIRKVDNEGTIAVISDEKFHTYSRPLISYFLADEITYDRVFYRRSDFYEKKKVVPILGKKAIKIDFENKAVMLEDKSLIGFDKLLLATGGEPFVPKIAGMDIYDYSTFTTLNDALKLKDKLENEEVKSVVILGGGLIGLKAAEGIYAKGVEITVVELANRILSPVLDETAAGLIQKVIEQKGIKVMTNHTISEIVGENGKVKGVLLDKGERIDCDIVIIAIGVRPRVDLVKDTPIKINRGIVVDKNMRTTVPDIYACGDCAEVYDFILDNYRLTPLWPTAHVGGRIAGFNMAGIEKEYVWGTGMNSVDFFGFPVISAGFINPPEGQEMEVLIKHEPEKMIYKKFLIKDNRIVGMIFVNEVDRAGVILGLMRDKIDISPFKDEILLEDFGQIHIPENLRREPSALEARI